MSKGRVRMLLVLSLPLKCHASWKFMWINYNQAKKNLQTVIIQIKKYLYTWHSQLGKTLDGEMGPWEEGVAVGSWQLAAGSWVGLCCWSRVLAACVPRWFRHNKLTFFGHFSAPRSGFTRGTGSCLSFKLLCFSLFPPWLVVSAVLQGPRACGLRGYWLKSRIEGEQKDMHADNWEIYILNRIGSYKL